LLPSLHGTGFRRPPALWCKYVQGYESNLRIIDQIVKRVDVRPVQVLIEAVIISVDLEHARQLGVNFAEVT
jgi:general secretion pathway protein D